jgi:hypothetical protein
MPALTEREASFRTNIANIIWRDTYGVPQERFNSRARYLN